MQPLHKLPAAAGRLLEAAAYLHDVGHYVSETGHHKHSAYLVANADLPGFTHEERNIIAALCRFHRKSMPQIRHSHFQMLAPDGKRTVLYLAPLLRIADALDRSHEQKVSDVAPLLKGNAVVLQVQADEGADLEIWAASEAANAFREVYSTPVSVQRLGS
jgi:exopolyphosphatase/guanosine-5'-triphosphate,3'-diphosphate pyrophosphatase